MKSALQTRSLIDALRVALQDAILRGEIPADTPLTEQAIAQQYSVARPTAKAAIERLVQSGLLRRNANKTARVPLLDTQDVEDLYSSRAIVERGVVRALATEKANPAAALHAIERLRNAIGVEDVAELVDADIEYHRALVACLGSPRTARLHDSIIGEAHLCMAQVQVHHLLHPRVIADEHTGILEAITAGDAEQAEQRMDQHLSRARDRLLGYLQERSDHSEKAGTSETKLEA